MAQLFLGDNLDILRAMADGCVDSIVTDPPYGLRFMGKRWDYDVPSVELWAECLRVLKPGGYLLAFAGTRTQHRMACRIEDAGFEIRDMIAWVYGSGFPKSLDVSKAIDKAVGAVRECTRPGKVTRDGYGEDWDTGDSATRPRFDNPATESAQQWQGWGTALKPALEPITLARKPLEGTVADNVLAHGTGALNIAACRVATPGADVGRWPANLAHDGSDDVLLSFPVTGPSKAGVRDPNGSMGYHGGASGLPGVVSGYADGGGSAARFFYCAKASRKDRDDGLGAFEIHSAGELTGGRAEGSAGLNCPRAGAGRTGGGRNTHPTVKPTDLMRYLCRLVTPPGGVVLDLFMGSGSTGKAAVLEGFQFIGIDREREYVEIARARILDAQRLVDESIFNPAKAGFFTPAGGEGGDG
jgi:site-specific DNA-methyltransferase (adenine-specific)